MLQFLTPLALAALAVLAVPVLIHLWSRGGGRRARVGSLRFLEASERSRFRAIRLTQVPLLLLRLALLASLVLLLARPVWIEPAADGEAPTARWVLVHPDVPARAPDAGVYELLDSLARAGDELRLLATGFPPVDLEEGGPSDGEAPDVWSLLREADGHLPAGSRLTVVAPRRLSGYRGARPVLHTPVAWRDVEENAVNRWLAAARWIGEDSLRVTVGVSHPSGTWFEQYAAAVSAGGLILSGEERPPLDLAAGGRQVVMLQPDARPQDDAQEIAPAYETRRFALIHSPDRRDDARYVEAALRAAAGASRLPLDLSVTTQTDAVPEADGVFWLHETPVPEALLARVEAGLILVSVAAGEAWEDVNRAILLDVTPPAAPPSLTRRVPPQRRGRALWTDSAGEPLLEQESLETGAHYRFHSRFHPVAGSLVLHPAFPEWIFRLLQGQEDPLPVRASDFRRISPAQRAPLQHAGSVLREPKPATRRLHGPLWLLALALFAVERWVAHRRSPF